MSFRNGDKSREHRQRKAKQRKRENVRHLLSKGKVEARSSAAAGAKKNAQ